MQNFLWPSNLNVKQNKYEKIYVQLILRCKNRLLLNSEYYETHHIIPDCFFKNRSRSGSPGSLDGNSDDENNLVILTPKEHYIAHRLLTKFITGPELHKMIYAMDIMAKSNKDKPRYDVPSRVYERNLILVSQSKKGKKLGPQRKKRAPPTPESNELRRQKLKGKPRLDLQGKPPHNKGKSMSEEQKQKLRGPRGPMSEEHKELRRGKRGPLKSPRIGKPRGPYKKNKNDDT